VLVRHAYILGWQNVGPLYMRTPRARGFVLPKVFLLYRVDNRIQAYSTKNRPVLGLG
jgi:hypothetical protein